MLDYLKDGYLPEDPKSACNIAAESCILDGLLWFLDWKEDELQYPNIFENNSWITSKFGGHFTGSLREHLLVGQSSQLGI